MNIDETDIVIQLEAMSPDALDALSFGVIRLDATGHVTFFSKTEANQSGFGNRPALGRSFLTDVAPCLGAPDFRKRLELAMARGTLDITFEQVGDFGNTERRLHVRMVSGWDDGYWVLIQRPR